MSLIKIFLDTLSLFLFLPLYWLYAIIWFIAFRGRLNDYPRVKKDETAKHLIFSTISIFAFIIFGNAYVEETAAKENVKNANKYIESTELSSAQNEEQLYTSLLDDESIENVDENESEETTDVAEIEISSSKGISPYYHPSVEVDSVSEQAYYETSSQSDNNNYEQTIEKNSDYKSSANENTNNNIDNSTSANENYSNNDYNFNKYNNPENQNTTMSWILNTYSQKIHKTGIEACDYVDKIAPEHYSTSNEGLDILKAQGYTLCGHCF